MRYLYALIVLSMLMAAGSASAGKFTVEMPLDTYIDSGNSSQSFGDEEGLWAVSEGDKPQKEVYLNFANNFGSAGVFKPDQIESALLKIDATDVKVPGKISVYFAEGSITDIDWDNKLQYETDKSVPLEVDQEGVYSVDVTPLIQRAREACPEDCGYSLVLVADGNASVGFASSESSDGGPELAYTAAE